MKDSIIYNKSIEFAIRIINLSKYLVAEKKEFVMSKQLLRSGTSIGANVSESLSAESDSDFIHKLSISQKEANETAYWLLLLYKTDYLNQKEYQSMNNDCEELCKIITSIILTKKENLKNKKEQPNHDAQPHGNS